MLTSLDTDRQARWCYQQRTVLSGTYAQCRYCARAQTYDCPPVDCVACGTRQCHSMGSGRGTCAVCLVGYLPEWSRPDKLKVCGYAACGEVAIAEAPRVRSVCRGHLNRPTVTIFRATMSLADAITGRVAHRDAGVGWQRWRFITLPPRPATTVGASS